MLRYLGPNPVSSLFTPLFCNSLTKDQSPNVLLPVVAYIVAHHVPAIGPAAHDRLLQLQFCDDRVYIICPVLAIFKYSWIAQFVGEAMSADIHSHQVKLLCQVALKLLVPRQTSWTVH